MVKLYGIDLDEKPKGIKRSLYYGLNKSIEMLQVNYIPSGGDGLGNYSMYIDIFRDLELEDEIRNSLRQLCISGKDYHKSLKEYAYLNFLALYEGTDKVLTSEDLKLAGFDDSNQPKYSDYIDDYLENY